jgi:hypothetical protein
MMSPRRASDTRLHWMDAVLGTFRTAGFSAKLTHHAYHALDSHITGFTLWIINLPATGDELRELAATALRELPLGDYPYLLEHIEYHLAPPADEQSEFEFGLGLILDGLERLHAMEAQRPLSG